MKILLIEDAERLRATLGKAFRRAGHAVDLTDDGDEGAMMGMRGGYDVVVLDRMLPGREGVDIVKGWRRAGITTPVLLLTALGEVEHRIEGLGGGADDYLTKPFALGELLARVEALGRRRYDQPDPILRIGPLEIDTARKRVRVRGAEVELTARDFALLECLARNPGQVCGRERLEERLYGDEEAPMSNAVDAAVYAVRKKLRAVGAADMIRTRRGLGYVLEL